MILILKDLGKINSNNIDKVYGPFKESKKNSLLEVLEVLSDYIDNSR
jgi:hypothetical protein